MCAPPDRRGAGPTIPQGIAHTFAPDQLALLTADPRFIKQLFCGPAIVEEQGHPAERAAAFVRTLPRPTASSTV